MALYGKSLIPQGLGKPSLHMPDSRSIIDDNNLSSILLVPSNLAIFSVYPSAPSMTTSTRSFLHLKFLMPLSLKAIDEVRTESWGAESVFDIWNQIEKCTPQQKDAWSCGLMVIRNAKQRMTGLSVGTWNDVVDPDRTIKDPLRVFRCISRTALFSQVSCPRNARIMRLSPVALPKDSSS
jgi:hypothetical protein